MSNYTYLGPTTGYQPALSLDIMVQYVRNPAAFPIVRYTDAVKTPKPRDLYVNWENAGQARIVQNSDFAFPDGAEAPTQTQGTDRFEFLQYDAKRYIYNDTVGYIAAQTASWDAVSNMTAQLTMKGMTARSARVATTLTTTTNYNSANVLVASVSGGATWANATSTTPSIRKTLMIAANLIQQGTLGVVGLNQLYAVMNPDTARTVATSQEWIDFIKQSPAALPIWQGQDQFLKYNIPTYGFGINWVIDDTVYVTGSYPTQTPSYSYTFPDNYCALIAKQEAIPGTTGGRSFASMMLFEYEPFSVFVYNDLRNRRYEIQVTEYIDDSFLLSPAAAVLIETNS